MFFYMARLLLGTMTSAKLLIIISILKVFAISASLQFLEYRNTESSPRPPQSLLREFGVRAFSFDLSPVHLQNQDYWLRALQWCGYLPSQTCLLCTSCFPTFGTGQAVSTGLCSPASFSVSLTGNHLAAY